MALYVYGIMRSGDAARAVEQSRAENSGRLEAVETDGISAVVTTTPDGDVRLRRDSALAHADVLQAAFEHGPVLPFAFGTTVADAETLERDLLAPSCMLLADRLGALEGKVEMQLKAVYGEELLLRSILAEDTALARSVQRSQAMPAAATHFERIRIGEAIAAAVQSRAAADGQALLNALAPLAVAHVISSPHHERAVLNAAFLVVRAELARFDQVVETLGRERGEEIQFRLIGPIPPYSFTASHGGTGALTQAGAAWA